ncbi:phage baseplate assembly protein V [Bradyrhizobium valentinum]|uniref:Gp5/Type VI secretion system Vgr protein OB-fold domain-containing protein n=1 Tax=Bradyrhizobium valentinum TaxID=1518501 RepID=A0A0R3L044_9BRAD|nr:phage baseplate assembly protein V [Bradyrhizobium valentinum]KRQ99276.1 hypothetical protein CP49_11815 [Bradyrhizobium valentinum]
MNLEDHLTELWAEVGETKRRIANLIRHGPITDIDAEKQVLRVRLNPESEDKPFKSAWIPYAQQAGEYKFHNPPVKGQNMTVIAPGGELGQAFAVPMTWSEKFPSPGDKEDEHVMKFDKVKTVIKKDQVTLTVGDVKIDIKKEDMSITIGDTKFKLTKETISSKAGEAIYQDASNVHIKGSEAVKIGGGGAVHVVSGANLATPPWVDGGEEPEEAPSDVDGDDGEGGEEGAPVS